MTLTTVIIMVLIGIFWLSVFLLERRFFIESQICELDKIEQFIRDSKERLKKIRETDPSLENSLELYIELSDKLLLCKIYGSCLDSMKHKAKN